MKNRTSDLNRNFSVFIFNCSSKSQLLGVVERDQLMGKPIAYIDKEASDCGLCPSVNEKSGGV